MSAVDIFPELIWVGAPVSKCLNVFEPDTFAIITSLGSVSVVKVNNSKIKTVIDNKIMFENPCKDYFTHPKSHYIWGYGVRDFYIINLKTNTQNKHIVSSCGNDMIYSSAIIDTANLKIWIDIAHHSFKQSDSNDITIIYDIKANEVVDTIYGYSGKVFLLNDGNTLCEIWDHPKPTTWKISSNLIQNPMSNELTDELSKLSINVLPKGFSKNTNFMIGEFEKNDNTIYATIKWDENYKDVSIEPFTIQKEKNMNLWEEFEISPDGKWAKTVARDMTTATKQDTITFFAVNDSFPQSLSLPVYGGVSSRNGGGCFVETDDWGTVYVDISPEMPGYLVVYKMRDVMENVIEKTQKLGQ